MRISDWISDVCSSDLPWSLQARLAWRLSAVLLGCMLFLAGAVTQYIWISVDDLDDVSLRVQSEQITRHINPDATPPRLELPAEIGRASCRERVCQYV